MCATFRFRDHRARPSEAVRNPPGQTPRRKRWPPFLSPRVRRLARRRLAARHCTVHATRQRPTFAHPQQARPGRAVTQLGTGEATAAPASLRFQAACCIAFGSKSQYRVLAAGSLSGSVGACQSPSAVVIADSTRFTRSSFVALPLLAFWAGNCVRSAAATSAGCSVKGSSTPSSSLLASASALGRTRYTDKKLPTWRLVSAQGNRSSHCRRASSHDALAPNN